MSVPPPHKADWMSVPNLGNLVAIWGHALTTTDAFWDVIPPALLVREREREKEMRVRERERLFFQNFMIT